MRPELLAFFAYAWWGLVPAYWKQLQSIPSDELILYRILLSTLLLIPFVLWRRTNPTRFVPRTQRHIAGLIISGLLIGGNWWLYVWAVNHGHIVESSLGYFINPLVNVLLGVVFLKERMSHGQKLACGFAAAGTTLLAWYTGVFPWIALMLALSFALYGFTRKLLQVPTIPGTFWETVLLSVPAACLFYLLASSGNLVSAQGPLSVWGWLSLCGIVTTVPLLAFAEAAKHLPLVVLAFFQFISPIFQFLLGVFAFGEPFGLLQWLAFSLIWVGLLIFLREQVRSLRGSS